MSFPREREREREGHVPFLKNIPFAGASCTARGAGEQQARSKDFGVGGNQNGIRKVEGKRWTDKGWTVKRNELLPCRRRSVTDSSVFISFWHGSLVSSFLIVFFDSCQISISSTRVSRSASSREGSERREGESRVRRGWNQRMKFSRTRLIFSKDRLRINILWYVSFFVKSPDVRVRASRH